MTERWVFLNGNFCFQQEATVSVTDRGFLFGEGIFTTLRVCDGKCELLKEHQHRLRQQAKELKFDCHFFQFEWISELIARNQAWQGTWRLKILATIKEEGMIRTTGCMLAILDPCQDVTDQPCSLCLFPTPIESPLAHIKSLSYLDHLYVRNFAVQRGFTDAITCSGEGFLLETGYSNFFWIDQNICWVPDFALPYLKGVFLQALLPHLPGPVQWIKAKFDQISASAHLYICNALHHVRPVIAIDQHVFARNQEIEMQLQEAIGVLLSL